MVNPKILRILHQHEEYRTKTINLIPSENIMSHTARSVLASDLVHRYIDSDFYGGTKYAEEIVEITKSLAEEIFGGEYVSVDPLSGNIAHIATLLAFTRSGDKICTLDPKDGGYPFRYEDFERKPIYLAYSKGEYNIDVEKSKEIIYKEKPKIVYLGASIILFPQPVKDISEIAHDAGAIIIYDASHVLGLVAGKKFQEPLREGADVLIGSTHKTLGGPQGGLIVSMDRKIGEKIEYVLKRPPILVDNPHVHRIGALSITLLEIKRYGREYARDIVRNAKILAKKLDELGFFVLARERGYTESHQILSPRSSDEGTKIRQTLEKAHIIVDSYVRIGTQEVTRLGMKEKQMIEIAKTIVEALNGDIAKAKEKAIVLASLFKRIHYSLDIQYGE